MYEIDHEVFGAFVARLRKEKGMTQKELAERLFVSDKAVSKWERGLSLPDIALLQPMADILGVTVTELLRGEYVRDSEPMTAEAVDQLLTGTLAMAAQEREQPRRGKRFWGMCYVLALAVGVLATAGAWYQWGTEEAMVSMLLTPTILAAVFGAYACFFARERLPAFYDGNKINFVSDGAFRMNIPGVHFNNSNWPYILKAVRLWSVLMLALWPVFARICYAAAKAFLPADAWAPTVVIALLVVLFAGLFLPLVIVGRKYE